MSNKCYFTLFSFLYFLVCCFFFCSFHEFNFLTGNKINIINSDFQIPLNKIYSNVLLFKTSMILFFLLSLVFFFSFSLFFSLFLSPFYLFCSVFLSSFLLCLYPFSIFLFNLLIGNKINIINSDFQIPLHKIYSSFLKISDSSFLLYSLGLLKLKKKSKKKKKKEKEKEKKNSKREKAKQSRIGQEQKPSFKE